MDLWSANRWGARIRNKDESHWIDLNRPFALVGSDPRCAVQIGDSRLPAVVYLVVACGDRIEVWPTCPLAFPIWGRVKKNHVLLVGNSRIRFHFKEDDDQPAAGASFLRPDDEPEPVFGAGILPRSNPEQDDDSVASAPHFSTPMARLILDWGSGPRHKSLNRNVMIIGEDHPSLIRLHGSELDRCSHGVVCIGHDVWLIDLHPERLAAGEEIIQHLIPGNPSILLGDVHVWVEGAEPVDPATLAKSEQPVDRGRSVAIVTSEREFGPPLARSLSDHGTKMHRVPSVGETDEEEVENWTMDLTDRLLEKNARKSLRRRIFKVVALTLLSLMAMLVVAVVLVRGVLPIIRSIYQQ
jgi:hypothetical protein